MDDHLMDLWIAWLDRLGLKERVYLHGPAGTGRGFAARRYEQPKPAPEPCTFRPTLHLYMGVGQRGT